MEVVPTASIDDNAVSRPEAMRIEARPAKIIRRHIEKEGLDECCGGETACSGAPSGSRVMAGMANGTGHDSSRGGCRKGAASSASGPSRLRCMFRKAKFRRGVLDVSQGPRW